MRLITLRCSSLPMLTRCSASLHLLARKSGWESGEYDDGIIEIDPYNPQATLGTAVHEMLAGLVRTGRDADTTEIGGKYGLDEEQRDEAAMLYHQGKRIWVDHLQRHMPGRLEVESRLEHDHETSDGATTLRLSGQADVMSIAPTEVVITDWKSGYVEGEYEDQVRGYALLACLKHNVQSVKAIVVFLRSGRYRVYVYSRDELVKWFATRVVGEVLARMRVYAPGDHCTYCPAMVRCAPRQEYLQNAVTDLVAPDKGGASVIEALNDPRKREIAAPVLGRLWSQMKMVELTIERLRQAVKESVQAHGPIDLPGGKQLAVSQSCRTIIGATEAMPVLEAALGQEEARSVLTVRNGELEKAVRARAPKGAKHKAWEAVMSDLKNAGAVSERFSARLELVDKAETQAESTNPEQEQST